MDDAKDIDLQALPETDGLSSEDRKRADLEHAQTVEDAAKSHSSEPSDAEFRRK